MLVIRAYSWHWRFSRKREGRDRPVRGQHGTQLCTIIDLPVRLVPRSPQYCDERSYEWQQDQGLAYSILYTVVSCQGLAAGILKRVQDVETRGITVPFGRDGQM